jgi:hypothetical protein
MSSFALDSKIIPLGFTRKRLATPLDFTSPSIVEIWLPVIRAIILSIATELSKKTVFAFETENSLKL